MKTFDQCKDEFAQQQNFKDWADYEQFMFATKVSPVKKKLAIEGAVKLYAQEVAKDAWERAIKAYEKLNNLDVAYYDFPPYQPK